MGEVTQRKNVPVDKLIPYVNNAKIHSEDQVTRIASSIREFGFLNPVLVDKDYNIIAGHGRVMAAKKLEMQTVPCLFVEGLTEAQRKAYILADNKLGELADWDMELVSSELEMLLDDDFDVDLIGFTEDELQKILNQDDTEAEDDDFDVDAELEKPTFSEAGDIWLLGRHRLICGDSTDQNVIDTLMDGKKANLVVTDPPYNVNYEGSAGKIKNDNMASDQFYQFLFDAFSCMEQAMANDASIYVFHADTEGLNFRKAFQDAGFYLSGCCIWEKPSLVLGRSPYQWQHEPCLYGWKAKGKHQWYSGRSDTTIWKFEKPKKNADHPTMKPIPLIAYPIKNSSMTNSIVLDPFGGSGSTLIACEQTERICCTCELDEKYCDVIVNRYIEQVGSSADVYVIRSGEKVPYADVHVEV